MSDDDLRARVLVARVTHRYDPRVVTRARHVGTLVVTMTTTRCRCGRREDDRAHE